MCSCWTERLNMKNEKKIKVSEAVRLFAHVTGKDPNAFYKQIERNRYTTLETIDGVQYLSLDELYANLPINEDGEHLLPVNTVAKNKNINVYELKMHINKGTIPAKIIGYRTYINPKDVDFLIHLHDVANSPNYISVKKFAIENNLNPYTIIAYATKGKFKTAVKAKNQWFVSKDDPFIKEILDMSLPEGYVSIEEYANLHNIDRMKVVNDVRRGLYKTSILINLPARKEKWFLHKDDVSVIDSLTEVSDENFLTVDELSEKFNMKKSTILHKIHNGQYPSAKKIGSKWYVNSEEVKPLYYGLVRIKTYSDNHNVSVGIIRKRIHDGLVESAIRVDGVWYLDDNEILT